MSLGCTLVYYIAGFTQTQIYSIYHCTIYGISRIRCEKRKKKKKMMNPSRRHLSIWDVWSLCPGHGLSVFVLFSPLVTAHTKPASLSISLVVSENELNHTIEYNIHSTYRYRYRHNRLPDKYYKHNV